MRKSRQSLNLPTAASCFPPNYATRFMKKGNHATRHRERKGFSSCNFSILRHTEKQDCRILSRPLKFQFSKVSAQPESLFRPQRFPYILISVFPLFIPINILGISRGFKPSSQSFTLHHCFSLTELQRKIYVSIRPKSQCNSFSKVVELGREGGSERKVKK